LYLSSYIGRDIRLRLETVLRTGVISHLPVLNIMDFCYNKEELFTALCCNDCSYQEVMDFSFFVCYVCYIHTVMLPSVWHETHNHT
jgi:hypothetical protein